MKVLMLTSELWPVFSGGLGVAVYEFVRHTPNVDFTVAIPDIGWEGDLNAKIIRTSDPGIPVYFYEGEPILAWDSQKDIVSFNRSLATSCKGHKFDLIHANDWMTVLAGIDLKSPGTPLVFHIHSTEYDRTNDNPRPWVVGLEKRGAQEAELVIANSHRTKRELETKYGINPNKVVVIYNGINLDKFGGPIRGRIKKPGENVVLFVGRLTVQKGVWHLLHAAKRVIDEKPNTKFVIVGSGSDKSNLIQTAIGLGIENNVIFTGKISDDELLAAYRMCDMFVMPSVNEPFGIVALEALASSKPVVMSKTAGVGEVVEHCFKVDYWDVDLMASRILEVLHYNELKHSMGQNGHSEAEKLSWENVSKKLRDTYGRLVHA